MHSIVSDTYEHIRNPHVVNNHLSILKRAMALSLVHVASGILKSWPNGLVQCIHKRACVEDIYGALIFLSKTAANTTTTINCIKSNCGGSNAYRSRYNDNQD